MTHDSRHHVVYDCTGAEHTLVSETLKHAEQLDWGWHAAKSVRND